jgi:hypothetical protein
MLPLSVQTYFQLKLVVYSLLQVAAPNPLQHLLAFFMQCCDSC